MDPYETYPNDSYSDFIRYIKNLGDGRFDNETQVQSGPLYSLGGLFVSDLDGDGDVDVDWAQPRNQFGLYWRENVDGQLSTYPRRFIVVEGVEGVEGVVPADLDGDGDEDLLGIRPTAIGWFEHLAGHEFAEFRSIHLGQAGPVLAVDLDGDGDRDLVAARQDASLVEVVPNLGGGQFGRVCGSLVETAAPLTLLTAADLDGDGDLDLLTGVYTFEVGGDLRGEVAWYRNLGDWTFAPPHVLDGRPGITGLLAIDVDRDGDPDLVSASETHDGFTSTEDGLEWRGNLGQGRFGKPRRRTDLPVRALAVGDVLGNRLPELTIATWIDDLRWFGWTRIAARGALFRHPMTGGPGVSTRRPLPPERLPRSEYRA